MDHPENWPKHFPPFHEARRPDRWPLWRAVLWSAFFFLNAFAFTCPRWMIPIVYPNFPWLVSNSQISFIRPGKTMKVARDIPKKYKKSGQGNSP